MEVRISRILSEYYEYTRKESEQYIRDGRVKINNALATIGDKATINDNVCLDDVPIPLKGIFRKVQREQANKNTLEHYNYSKDEELSISNPKSSSFRKGRKNEKKKHKGKNNIDELKEW